MIKLFMISGLFILCVFSPSLGGTQGLGHGQNLNQNTGTGLSQNSGMPMATQQIKWLGVSLEAIPDAVKNHLGNRLYPAEGIMIKDVQKDSPAQRSGLQRFDILTRFNGHKITSAEQVYKLVQQSEVDKIVQLEIIHQGVRRMLDTEISVRDVVSHSPQAPFSSYPTHPSFRGLNQLFNSRFRNDPFVQPNWNRPFFNKPNGSGFNTPFFSSIPQNIPQNQPGNKNSNSQGWSHSESMSVNTLADGKIHAELKTKDSNGNTKNFVFEGGRQTVIKQIQQQKDLPDNQKQILISAIQGYPLFNFNDKHP